MENFMLVSLVVEVVCCLGVLGWIGLRRADGKRFGEDEDEQPDLRGEEHGLIILGQARRRTPTSLKQSGRAWLASDPRGTSGLGQGPSATLMLGKYTGGAAVVVA